MEMNSYSRHIVFTNNTKNNDDDRNQFIEMNVIALAGQRMKQWPTAAMLSLIAFISIIIIIINISIELTDSMFAARTHCSLLCIHSCQYA